jgi:SAM-dependent methyltransferase
MSVPEEIVVASVETRHVGLSDGFHATDAQILSEVAAYYSKKVLQHGPTPQGVDWKGRESQELRFRELLRCLDNSTSFSLNDLGCGYGALAEYMIRAGFDFSYSGYDIASPMIEAAQAMYASHRGVRFLVSASPSEAADFAVASGIFNVRQGRCDSEWLSFVLRTIDTLFEACSRSFSFNCLTSYADIDKRRADLFYADPCFLFDHCKRRFGGKVSLLHDYALHEFTIIVRRGP